MERTGRNGPLGELGFGRIRGQSALAFLTGAGLFAFHARLLGTRLSDGSLFEPGVALKWTAALLLLLGWALLRRRVLVRPTRRHALPALWLAIAALHIQGPPIELPQPSWIETSLALPAGAALAQCAARLLGRAMHIAISLPVRELGRLVIADSLGFREGQFSFASAPRAPPIRLAA